MSGVEQQIDVAAPLDAVYAQWTRFEELPRFVDGVDEVEEIDATHLLWRASHDGASAEWTCEVVEARPQERIAWRSTSGLIHGGVLSFLRLGDEATRVLVMAEIDGADDDDVTTRISTTLNRFKELIERR